MYTLEQDFIFAIDEAISRAAALGHVDTGPVPVKPAYAPGSKSYDARYEKQYAMPMRGLRGRFGFVEITFGKSKFKVINEYSRLIRFKAQVLKSRAFKSPAPTKPKWYSHELPAPAMSADKLKAALLNDGDTFENF